MDLFHVRIRIGISGSHSVRDTCKSAVLNVYIFQIFRVSGIMRGRGTAKFRQVNPTKFTQTGKIPQNSLKIVPNTCWYNIFRASRIMRFFSLQIMHYFLANCAPKILNYAQIMQIAQYFLAKN